MKKQIKSVIVGILALALAGVFVFWAIDQASQTEFVPRSEITPTTVVTTTTTPPSAIEPSPPPTGLALAHASSDCLTAVSSTAGSLAGDHDLAGTRKP